MAFKSPPQIVEALRDSCAAKVCQPAGKVLLLGFLAGAYIAFGALLAIIIGKGIAPTIVGGVSYSGFARFMFAAVFPVGLILTVIAGAELFTGNTAVLIPGVLGKQIRWADLGRNWILSYAGNFLGSLFIAYILAYLTGLCGEEPYLSAVKIMTVKKTDMSFLSAFLKGVGCNWLVCLAVWMACASDEIIGKILSIWFPIMAFVGLGFEHCIANMFFIPAGIFYGADVTIGRFLTRNLLPVTFGNIVGGAFFVGCIYWRLYGKPAGTHPRLDLQGLGSGKSARCKRWSSCPRSGDSLSLRKGD